MPLVAELGEEILIDCLAINGWVANYVRQWNDWWSDWSVIILCY